MSVMAKRAVHTIAALTEDVQNENPNDKTVPCKNGENFWTCPSSRGIKSDINPEGTITTCDSAENCDDVCCTKEPMCKGNVQGLENEDDAILLTQGYIAEEQWMPNDDGEPEELSNEERIARSEKARIVAEIVRVREAHMSLKIQLQNCTRGEIDHVHNRDHADDSEHGHPHSGDHDHSIDSSDSGTPEDSSDSEEESLSSWTWRKLTSFPCYLVTCDP